MNLALQANEAFGEKARFEHEAIQQCIEAGYILENLTPSTTGFNFAYDQENNRFLLLDEKFNYVYGETTQAEVSAHPENFFVVVDNQAAIDKAKIEEAYLSVYLRESFEEKTVKVYAGVDTGNTAVEKIVYKTERAQSVLIRTNSYETEMEIDAKNSTVKHYGVLGNLVVEKVAMASYDEYGRVGGTCLITEGHIVVADEGEITSIAVNNTDTKKVNIETKGDGTVGIVFVASQEIANEMKDSNNSGVNDWFYTFKDDGGNDITKTEDIIAKINSIANDSVLYIKETNIYYNDFASAFAAVLSGQTLILVRDTEVEYNEKYIQISNNKTLTFDLNGHILHASTNAPQGVSTNFIVVDAGSTLNIKDSTDTSKDGTSSGRIENLAAHANLGSFAMVSNSNDTILNNGTLNVYGGTIVNLSTVDKQQPQTSYIAQAAFAIDAYPGSVTNIYGGCIRNDSGFSHTIRLSCGSLTNTVTMNISGGIVYNAYRCAIWIQNPSSNNGRANLTIFGGIIETGCAFGDRECIGVGQDGMPSAGFEVSITGGKFINNGQDVTSYQKGLNYKTYANKA